MTLNSIHIVSFDIPVPVNYGGAIDIFYKLKALQKKGIAIHLHCFQYGGRKPAHILNTICERVYYYPRKSFSLNYYNKPYIVASRSNAQLIERLLSDDSPILFEGLHSCYYLSDKRLKNRKKIVRTHNIEHNYYQNLAIVETNIAKKIYLKKEAAKLADFEKVLSFADGIAVISKNDYYYYFKKHTNVVHVSAFHQNKEVNIKPGKGNYALYHGSLEVNENNVAALYLINEVFNDIDKNLIIAGNNPLKQLISAVEGKKNIKLISNVNVDDIQELVRNAHINILPTFQTTGIKLKLLLSLYTGRHCLVNSPMVENSGLEDLCFIANNSIEFKRLLGEIFEKEFVIEEIDKRKKYLKERNFDNDSNADKLIKLIFG